MTRFAAGEYPIARHVRSSTVRADLASLSVV
jgi:hypothetical protein